MLAIASPVRLLSDDLGVHALALLAVEPGKVPHQWRTAAFAARVERTRRQLEPILEVGPLGSSFEREAFWRSQDAVSPGRRADAVRVAYGMRWLELASALRLPGWACWLGVDG